MTSNGYEAPPDLTTVLKTLSAFAPPASNQTSRNSTFSHGQSSFTNQSDGPKDDDDDYEPSDVIPPSQPYQYQYQAPQRTAGGPPTSSQSQTPDPRHAAKPTPTPTPTSSTVDPSTITAWPAALKYVMKTVSQNEALQAKIRRLIHSQHEHERQWWRGREALLEKQKARGEKKKQLEEVLRSVGAPVDTSKEISTAEEDRAEITNYDAKVYKASVDMAKALDSELRALGIPFFALKHSLVSSTSPPDKTDTTEQQQKRGDTTTTVTREELLSLQRRMLELLQDLCKE
ncbi:hypothetical protein VTN00DRAFT_273 [Thermoascus crustaceus]|uniref:uncharacterized protein n=1 Tax=Thermoascus crustaceus TaxID=5088 RepID=UPI00374297E2